LKCGTNVIFVGVSAVMIAKLYCQYLRNEKGKPALYVQLKKALFGTLKAVLLF
jgi:hypothetical protein